MFDPILGNDQCRICRGSEKRKEDNQSRGNDIRRSFPHLCETFYSIGVQYDDIRPSGTAILKYFETLYVNAIEGMEVKGEDVKAMVHPMTPGATLRN